MQQIQPRTVTRLLADWGYGDQSAFEELLPLIYRELYEQARRLMRRERLNYRFQTTELISEVYLRLAGMRRVKCESCGDLFAVCANLMRQILVDLARSNSASKRGGGYYRISLEEVSKEEEEKLSQGRPAVLLALDDALKTLAGLNRRQSLVVKLRYFGGLSVNEAASVLKVSPETVKRDWRLAKVWLRRELIREAG